MKNALKNSTPAIVFFVIMFTIALLATNASAQTTTEEPSVAFRYDGFSNPDDAPASISKERLQDDNIERKMYRYEMLLPNGIGLPSMEDIHKNIIEEVMKALPHVNIPVSNLINPEWDGCWNDYMANLINPDWDGANRG